LGVSGRGVQEGHAKTALSASPDGNVGLTRGLPRRRRFFTDFDIVQYFYFVTAISAQPILPLLS
jgi:hypothetical protein